MKTKLLSLIVLLTSFCAGSVMGQDPNAFLRYGVSYRLQNGFAGVYLDTLGTSVCQKGVTQCVSAALPGTRASLNSQWFFIPADDSTQLPDDRIIRDGARVRVVNEFPLLAGSYDEWPTESRNKYGGFLQVMGRDCEGNPLCVATGNRQAYGQDVWIINALGDNISGQIPLSMKFNLANAYDCGNKCYNGTAYLETRGSSDDGDECDGNTHCVSAGPPKEVCASGSVQIGGGWLDRRISCFYKLKTGATEGKPPTSESNCSKRGLESGACKKVTLTPGSDVGRYRGVNGVASWQAMTIE